MSIQKASSITPLSTWKYDVFLSFRGEDTRKNFVDHLHAALERGGINVFKDDKELEKGKSILPELSTAIEDSRISIIVFSRNYASSTWCLDELVKIVQCMKIMNKMVFPIFYDVHPSLVRKQTGNFQEAFAKHEEAYREHIEKVQNWRNALTEVANLSGWYLKDRHESEFIQNIVNEISSKLCPTTLRNMETVGIYSRLEKLKLLIGVEFDDVRMIGICGMGGIGKTTIARIVYDSISCEFKGSSFLANVREISGKCGMVVLQKQLLSQILREVDIKIWDVYDGINMIRSRLWNIKVLIVIDDVDDIKQLNELVGKHDWFGSGSRIIITTRDEHLLLTHGVDKIYKVEALQDEEALQLFSLKAFKNYQPSKNFVDLSKHVVKYASGLPLALEVLGSFLFGRTVDEWESALQRLDKDFDKRIMDTLQISFDGLKETEKKIFLDIACFFKGKNKGHVTRILDGCDFNPTIGISVLIHKSLITISYDNILWMHDLLQEMGRYIVKRESFDEPGKRSRLWKEADVFHVLTKNTGTEVVEAIILEKEVNLSASAKVFSKMINLRLLKFHNMQLHGDLEYLSNELRLLDWNGYPLQSLPSNLQLNKIVELKMHFSRFKQLWKEIKPLNMLKIISLSHSKNLTKTPDFTEVPNLEELILEGCTRLHDIHPSILVHKKIVLLNLIDCRSLTSLPSKIDMQSLKKFILSGCLKLKNFPKIVQRMECLSELFLDGSAIQELPQSIELLTGLVLLSLEDCNNLITLPNNIKGLKSLKTLNLSGCSKLENVPENLGLVESLEELDISGTAIRQPVSSIFAMKNLKDLSFRGCKGSPTKLWHLCFPFSLICRKSSGPAALMLPCLSGLNSLTKLDLSDCNLEDGDIPSEVGSLVSLESLSLSKNNFASLPASINLLSNLIELELEGCKRLQSLPELPSYLTFLKVDACTSLETLQFPSKLFHWPFMISCLNCLELLDCHSVECALLKAMPNSSNNFNIIVPGSKIPKWFSHQSEGSSIKIKSSPHLYTNSKLVGHAVCAIFLLHDHPSELNTSPYFWLTCNGKAHGSFSSESLSFSSHNKDTSHIWLLYFPCFFLGRPGEYYQAEFNFESSSASTLEVKRCAVLPVYKQEGQELNHPMNQCSSSISENLDE